MPQLPVQQAFELALQHHHAGSLDSAEALYRQILAAYPRHADALHHLGLVAYQTGRHELALEWIRQALALTPNNPAAHSNLGEVCRTLGHLDEAIAAYRQAIALKPDYAEAYGNLGAAYRRRGCFEEAAAAYRQALQLRPDYPEAHNNLGLLLAGQGQFDAAIAAYRRALDLKPNYPAACVNLSDALSQQGQLDEAATVLRRAVQIAPDFPQAHLSLGNILVRQYHLDEAIAVFHRALQLDPDFPEAYNNLGVALTGKGLFDEAAAAHRHALQLQPDYADAANNLGNLLKDIGELDEALAAYRRALAVDPDQAEVHSNLIFALHFLPEEDEEAITEEHERWNQRFGESWKRFLLPHTNGRNPERRLRIGYVSPDFRFHAVAFFFAPLLEAHDREHYEIYCYASVERADAVTDRLRKSADVWRDVHPLSETQLAERVRSDGIDILVDLAMHTADNRLTTFARRPAPVQVSWLAYPGSTGLEAIDYRLTDAHIEPVSQGDEGPGGKVVRLPDSWCCYAPLGESPPVSPLPAAQTGYVTFGSLNQFGKIHQDLVRCWASLLRVMPKSRLLMVCPEGRARERTQTRFAMEGVAQERLEWIAHCSWPDYIRLFERIDLALDTYPCNGMTTTCHALWMGVPVVTQMGNCAVSRAGSSLLHTVGLGEWIAQNEEEYINIAAKWAADLPRLAELRGALRLQMRDSPLMDTPGFARNMETAYRAMWRRWCAEK